MWIENGYQPITSTADPTPPNVGSAVQHRTASDPVNHPAHYTDGGIETIDFIEAKKLDYHKGNAVKYISRAGKKGDEVEDLRKAIWYLERRIKILEGENNGR